MTGNGESLEVWFKREVLSHEEHLTRFLSRLWPRSDELADLRQEAYARVYEAAQKERPRQPKAFLFATARHLTTDRVRRERVVRFLTGGDDEVFNVLVDEVSPEQQVAAHGELSRLARALDQLTARSREVVWLRRVQQYSQKEVAERLGVSEKAVEKHLSIGVRRLAVLMGC
jgi:RNA polymerase sigma-70 factor (ECF subfamily)